MTEDKIGIIKLDAGQYAGSEIKIKSLSDLKSKIQKEDTFTVVKFLIKEIVECDIDSDIYFKIKSANNIQELYMVIDTLLKVANSRKYDENARHILLVLRIILGKEESIKK